MNNKERSSWHNDISGVQMNVFIFDLKKVQINDRYDDINQLAN